MSHKDYFWVSLLDNPIDALRQLCDHLKKLRDDADKTAGDYLKQSHELREKAIGYEAKITEYEKQIEFLEWAGRNDDFVTTAKKFGK